jgi:MaoC like domain
MISRCFTMESQLRFAGLSGDCNPLHIDPVAARRSLLGGAAVHGVHLLLWALDMLATGSAIGGFARLRVQFERCVAVGNSVDLVWHDEGHRLVGRLTDETGILARVSLTSADRPLSQWSGATELGTLACEEHELAGMQGKAGQLELILPSDWAAMFPHLARSLQADMVALLLSTTRLVGMVIPGLHSMYSGLDLRAEPGVPTGKTLHYEVTRIDPRIRLVEMAVQAGGVHGTIIAFARPKPFAQRPISELCGAVRANEFAGQEAIVIGGSRGLGELTAKLLAVGGASVTITWQQGEADAQAIVAEAAALGLAMRAQPFNALEPPFQEPDQPIQYTHLYYFATPRIPGGKPGRFDSAIFSNLLNIYVLGFVRTMTWVVSRAVPNACIWFPSTIFIEQPDPHFAEYAAAKACGEALCARLCEQMAPLRFVTDRLPRLSTDQTQGLTDLRVSDGVSNLLAILRRHAIL